MSYENTTDAAIIEQVGSYVRYQRINQGRTQAELAHDAGISRSTLSLLERGGTVTIATLVQVLRVLGRLDVFSAFEVNERPSPLLLAKLAQQKRERVRSKKTAHRPSSKKP